MPDVIARHCFVSGRVQGVFYRASARQKATEFGVAGYARNLADGRVEVLAVGDVAAVESLIDWLWIGPPSARVSTVDIKEIALDELGDVPVGFATR
jgi:acylphosphatase